MSCCAKTSLNLVKSAINARFVGKEPWQIVACTTSTVLLTVWMYNFIFDDEPIVNRIKRTFFKYIKLIPSVRRKIESEMDKVNTEFEQDMSSKTAHLKYFTTLPEKALSSTEILEIVDDVLSLGSYDYKAGLVSGTVYTMNQAIRDITKEVYGRTSYTNPLHTDVFPGICKLEAEIVRITANLFHGDSKSCGCVTSGGTESILMACKAYRDYARAVRGVKKPEIVVPVTIHSAFDKAAQYFNLRVKSIPVDNNYQVNIKAMKRAISSNTVMIAGSAPNYPYGTIDDIEAISELGRKYNIPVHVDGCLGGLLTVFMNEAGYPTPVTDFRLPGVTSISADTHKYGYTPKGTSVILYSDTKYRHYQYTVTTDWPGGVYGSPTVAGSRAGGNIAVCWATMLTLGKEGYVKATRDVIHTTRYIEKHLREIPSIFIFGQPATSVVAIGSNVFEIYRLATMLNEKGWNLNTLQYPSAIHICVTHVHAQPGVADRFINDIKTSLEVILKDPKQPVEGKMALYGQAQSIPDRSIVGDFTRCFIDSIYYTPKGSAQK
ncbi:sphingosine-1-phosphate lyase 1 [Holotrichia oblita]|uniref:Sphingosine-1-phosphate lyase 1 n=1 Tax=Holotrichia oblita TaxID=644536 RepID=A0ACB9SR01_HOLOL|nr:sphingosine-1-phosphate lyase 1 [Holotrichia oblita]